MSSTSSRPTHKVKVRPDRPTDLEAFDNLRPRQQRFVEEYLIDHNASRRAAAYSATIDRCRRLEAVVDYYDCGGAGAPVQSPVAPRSGLSSARG